VDGAEAVDGIRANHPYGSSRHRQNARKQNTTSAAIFEGISSSDIARVTARAEAYEVVEARAGALQSHKEQRIALSSPSFLHRQGQLSTFRVGACHYPT